MGSQAVLIYISWFYQLEAQNLPFKIKYVTHTLAQVSTESLANFATLFLV